MTLMNEKAKTRNAPEKSPQQGRATKQGVGVLSSLPSGNPIFTLQHAVGNQSILQLLESGAIQPKLRVSKPGDADEVEADRVAASIVSSSVSPTLHRECACTGGGSYCPQCESEAVEQAKGIHRKSSSSSAAVVAAPENLPQNLGPGSALDPNLRKNMESKFGRDFGDVRIHADSRAAASARAVHARAFTLGKDVVFNQGEYSPETQSGKQLLAHELTHVVQQEGRPPTSLSKAAHPDGRAKPSSSSANDRKTRLTDRGAAVPAIQHVASPALMRAPLFDSTVQICHRVLKSRVFHVSEGGIVVVANAAWEPSPDWRGAEKPECGREIYEITLSRVGRFWDSDEESCEFQHGAPITRNWTNLPEGDYYLTIWTNNTNPNCCLQGTIQVSQQHGLGGPACGGGPARDVAAMSTAEKISRAISLSGDKIGGQVGERIKELLTPQAIATMAAFTAAYVISQTTPIGWVADILVAGLIAATVLMVGSEAVEIVKLLMQFFEMASNAKSVPDLEKAAEVFAKALTKAGIDIIIAIIFHKAGKALDLKPSQPRSPGLVEVLTKGGAKLSTILGPPEYADFITADGTVVRMPVERVPNAMMMEGQKPGGRSPKGGGPAVDTAEPETAFKELKKETGAQQERRLLKEDRTSGRPANSATYHAYEGGNRGSFRGWFNSLKSHIDATLKTDPAKPQLNESPLAENTARFIDRHPNLKAAWEKMNLKLDSQLKDIQSRKSAAAGDKVRIRELQRWESTLQTRRAELTNIESGEVGSKRPDLVEVFFTERRAIVTDITQRTGDPLHNFKTELYVDLIKEILGWSEVNGVNFNTVYDQNITP